MVYVDARTSILLVIDVVVNCFLNIILVHCHDTNVQCTDVAFVETDLKCSQCMHVCVCIMINVNVYVSQLFAANLWKVSSLDFGLEV